MTAGHRLGGAMICCGCADPVALALSACPGCGVDPLLDGRYALLQVLGRGSAGATTYKAQSLESGRLVAIKELPLRPADPPKRRELFQREVAILRQLHHPAIPRHIESFEAGCGKGRALYLVQEFIPGLDLAREMDRHRYSADEVLDIVDELLGVLTYLHGLSPPVIHRDLKPANIIRRASDRRLVVVDFGSVRDVLVDEELGGSTVAGTFGYMAPEQFRGDALPATDLYGVGALAVCLLTRREPHTMLDPAGHLSWQRHTRVGNSVQALLIALLEVDPRRRPGDAARVRHWLRAARRSPSHLPLPPVPGRAVTQLEPVRSSTAMVRVGPPSGGGASTALDAAPYVGMAVGVATGLGLLAMLVAMLVTVLGLVLI